MSHTRSILKQILIFASLIFPAQATLAAGFSRGNEIQTTEISGAVTAYCPRADGLGQETSLISCRSQMWEPDIVDYFVGPQVDADKVLLTATRDDGSQKSKDSGYDGQKGQSKSRFNLGISTLMQRPLLKAGRNSIHFTLSKNDSPVTEGDFEASVTPLPGLRCSHGIYQGFSSFDCQDHYRVCQTYFQNHNYCRE